MYWLLCLFLDGPLLLEFPIHILYRVRAFAEIDALKSNHSVLKYQNDNCMNTCCYSMGTNIVRISPCCEGFSIDIEGLLIDAR